MNQFKKLTLIFVLGLFTSNLLAQKIGGGLAVSLEGTSPLGISAQGLFNITETIDIAPAVTYYFFNDGSPDVSSSLIVFEADGHYNFSAGDNLVIHPIAGLSFWRVGASAGGFNVSATEFGLNLGGGAILNYDESTSFFGKLKYTLIGGGGGLGIWAGVYFSL
ncbi:MAG: hypothetical protein AAGK97_14375 [Bacteroidota bacterium]